MLGLPVGTTEREEEDVVDELDLTRLTEASHPRDVPWIPTKAKAKRLDCFSGPGPTLERSFGLDMTFA